MSDHHQFIYPRYPHLPAPDWQSLYVHLSEAGFILPTRGAQVPMTALLDLSFRLARVPGRIYQFDNRMRTAADVLALYVRAGYLPADLPITPLMNVEEAVALLLTQNIELCSDDSLEHSTWHSAEHCFGPAAVACFSPDIHAEHNMEPQAFGMCLLTYDKPYVPIGENFCSPSVPGSDEPLEILPPFGSSLDFIDAAYRDPAVQWVNPLDGRAYYPLDLDWQFSFGFGTRMIRVHGLDMHSTEALAAQIGKLIDQSMACHHRHL